MRLSHKFSVEVRSEVLQREPKLIDVTLDRLDQNIMKILLCSFTGFKELRQTTNYRVQRDEREALVVICNCIRRPRLERGKY